MANAHAHYQNSAGDLTLALDIDLKSENILDCFIKGSLRSQYEQELAALKTLVVGKNLTDISKIKRSDLAVETHLPNGKQSIGSLSLWLFYKAIDDYLGTGASLKENPDTLCLCYGVTKRDLKKEVLARSDYDLPQVIAETMATSACGSCLKIIQQTLKDLRSEHGRILGIAHAKTRLDKNGHWVKVKDMYPAELLIAIDDLQKVWMKREGIADQFQMEIVNIEGHHVSFKMSSLKGENDRERFEKVLLAFSDYVKSEIGVLLFLDLLF